MNLINISVWILFAKRLQLLNAMLCLMQMFHTCCNCPETGWAWHRQKSMLFSIHSKSKPPKFTFTDKYDINQNILAHYFVNLASLSAIFALVFPLYSQDIDIIKCESSNKHPCYKCQGFPLHVRTLPLRSVAGKEEVVCHNCILYRISID